MAVRLRLKRFGRKKTPFYRIVVANSTAARNGKTIEEVGTYNPLTQPVQLVFDKERIEYWISHGALPSETVQRLLSKEGVFPAREKKSKFEGVAKKDRVAKKK